MVIGRLTASYLSSIGKHVNTLSFCKIINQCLLFYIKPLANYTQWNEWNIGFSVTVQSCLKFFQDYFCISYRNIDWWFDQTMWWLWIYWYNANNINSSARYLLSFTKQSLKLVNKIITLMRCNKWPDLYIFYFVLTSLRRLSMIFLPIEMSTFEDC